LKPPHNKFTCILTVFSHIHVNRSEYRPFVWNAEWQQLYADIHMYSDIFTCMLIYSHVFWHIHVYSDIFTCILTVFSHIHVNRSEAVQDLYMECRVAAIVFGHLHVCWHIHMYSNVFTCTLIYSHVFWLCSHIYM